LETFDAYEEGGGGGAAWHVPVLTIGYLSVAAIGLASVPGLLVVPFSFGLGLLAAVFAFGHISGGHYNPAVTVALVLDKRIGINDALAYVVAQVVGAIAAAVLVMIVISQAAVTSDITHPTTPVTDLGALLIELVATAGSVIVILTVTKRAASIAGIVIPLTLVAIHFATATLSGASVNPARSIGSALVGGDLSKIWIYLVAPIVGAVLGRLVFEFMDDGAASA
jgi:MIP family channel proteins